MTEKINSLKWKSSCNEREQNSKLALKLPDPWDQSIRKMHSPFHDHRW
jgi:hypothetical protein